MTVNIFANMQWLYTHDWKQVTMHFIEKNAKLESVLTNSVHMSNFFAANLSGIPMFFCPVHTYTVPENLRRCRRIPKVFMMTAVNHFTVISLT